VIGEIEMMKENFIIEHNILHFKNERLPVGQFNIYLEYTAGYATTPADIENALVDYAKNMYEQKNNVSTERVGDYSVSYTSKNEVMPISFLSVIEKYR
jgi:hypothetical protein